MPCDLCKGNVVPTKQILST